MKAVTIIYITGLLSVLNGIAQQAPPVDSPIYLKTFTGQNEVLLRWSPADKYRWKDGLTAGYTLVRKTIFRNGEVLEHPEVVILASELTPAALEAWEKLVRTDPMAGVVAQAIYGKSFNTSGISPSSDIGEIMLQTDELTKRFTFSVFAADRSFQAAVMAGLGYTDRSVVEGEAYVYQVSLNHADQAVLNSALAYAATKNKTKLPTPQGPVAVAGDSLVVLTWNFEDDLEHYTTYNIERSLNDGDFYRLSEQPISPTSSDGRGNTSYVDYPETYGEYRYRITGLDVFGNESNPSHDFKVRLLPPFLVHPEITGYETSPDGNIVLHCLLHQQTNHSSAYMQLMVSDHPTGNFRTIIDSISRKETAIVVSQSNQVAYYRLLAKDAYDRSQESNIFQVQITDTIPPSRPEHVMAEQDEEGNIRITWKEAPEKDLMGYDVFFAPGEQFEFLMLNKVPIQQTGFTYTLQKNHSLKSARFKVRSVDKRYNVSEPSQPVWLEFRRKLPPPVIKRSFYQFGEGLEISWIAAHHPGMLFQVYRQDSELAEANQWQLLKVLQPQQNDRFTDREVIPGKMYRYTVTGKTALQGESEPSEPLTIKIPVQPLQNSEDELILYANREQRAIEVQWKLKGHNLKEVQLYRRKGDAPFTLYKTFSGESNRYSDDEVAPNNTYSYLVTGLYGNGQKMMLPESTVIF